MPVYPFKFLQGSHRSLHYMIASLISLSLGALFEPHEERSFLSWMRETNQLYTGDEYSLRLGIFISNSRYVREHNSVNGGFTVCLNKLAAMTPTEYNCILGTRQTTNIQIEENHPSPVKNDDNLDWRDKGIVNDVKDQGQCGDGWAFSAVACQESQWAMKKGVLLSLSEQDLLDCCNGCLGCMWGDDDPTFDYVIIHQAGLWNTESDYPYKGSGGKCQFDQSKGVTKTVSYTRVSVGDESKLYSGVTTLGVASVDIDAATRSFQLYSGGVFDDQSCSSNHFTHNVNVVGYGVEGTKPYWIVRNSWGSAWGENGYIRILRNAKNLCGIASDGIIPMVE